MEGTVILAAPVKIFMIQLKALLCLLQAVYDRSGVSVYVHMHIITIILPYEYHIHIYIYIQLLLCQSGNTPLRSIARSCVGQNTIQELVLSQENMLWIMERESQCWHDIQQTLSYNKNVHTTQPPPTRQFLFIHYSIPSKRLRKNKTNLFNRLFSITCPRQSWPLSLCLLQALPSWGWFLESKFLDSVLVSSSDSPGACAHIHHSRPRDERRIRSPMLPLGGIFGGVMAPPPKRHLEAGKQSGVRPIRCRVLLVFFLFVGSCDQKNHCWYRLVTQFLLFVHISLGTQEKNGCLVCSLKLMLLWHLLGDRYYIYNYIILYIYTYASLIPIIWKISLCLNPVQKHQPLKRPPELEFFEEVAVTSEGPPKTLQQCG